MVPISALSILAFCLFTEQSAAELGVVGFSFEKRQTAQPAAVSRRLRKRSGSVQATLYNADGDLLYLVNTTVGTPAQSIALQLDTGSSDIWVPWVQSQVCSSRGNLCSDGAYDPAKSSSIVDILPNEFSISYVDNTKIQGDYINETFGIGGTTIKQMTMGLAKQASVPGSSGQPFQGIIGVGFDSGEAIVGQTQGQASYPNIISQMVAQGVISTRAYSLWLNDLNSPQGSILFGGLDNAKFNGDLVVLPLQSDTQTNVVDSFTVTFAGLEVDGNGGKSVYTANSTAPVILDSGTSLTFLPDNIANAIIGGVGAVVSDTYGTLVPCEVGNTQGVFKFRFGNSNGPIISAKISQFVIPFPSGTRAPKFKSGSTACQWGILPSGDDPNLFGDTFLRSAYVVYNIDGKSVGIAETNFNVKNSDVKQITASNSIPGASSTASGDAQQTRTGAVFQTGFGGFSGGAATSTAVGTDASGTWDLGTATSSGSSSSSSTTHKAAAGSLMPPSTSFVGTIAAGVCVLFAMLGGSMLILI